MAKNPELSYLAQKAENVKTHKGSPEEFLSPKIKIAIGYEPISPLLKKLFKKRRVKLIALTHPESISTLQKQILFLTTFFRKKSLGIQWKKLYLAKTTFLSFGVLAAMLNYT